MISRFIVGVSSVNVRKFNGLNVLICVFGGSLSMIIVVNVYSVSLVLNR